MQLRRLLSSSLNSAVGVTGRTSRKCYLACGNSCAISSVALKGAFQSLPNKTKTPDDVIKINAALAVWRRAVTTQGRSNETYWVALWEIYNSKNQEIMLHHFWPFLLFKSVSQVHYFLCFYICSFTAVLLMYSNAKAFKYWSKSTCFSVKMRFSFSLG